MTRLALLHPGRMGASLGAAAAADVVWIPEGRSAASAERAAAFEPVDRLDDAAWALSIVPPAAALDVLHDALARGFRGTFIDANAIGPGTARALADEAAASGVEFVDAALFGGPAWEPGTRMYLSGESAEAAAALFEEPLDVAVLAGPVGQASALKCTCAAWTKGSAALMLDLLALADAEGVGDALQAEWARSEPDNLRRAAGLRRSAAKAWRYTGEMREIAEVFAENGLPDGFHRAAEEVFERLAHEKDRFDGPTGIDVARQLLAP
jgi:3-hydroxyisobutyrate dehydrogenase-like beta-hydroxyacid dehydrogenase